MSIANTRALAEALGLVPAREPDPEPAQQEPAPPDFDGGPRQSAPEPTDPVADHDELLLEVFRNLPTSGGGGQW